MPARAHPHRRRHHVVHHKRAGVSGMTRHELMAKAKAYHRAHPGGSWPMAIHHAAHARK
jgi:hypothetical protein